MTYAPKLPVSLLARYALGALASFTQPNTFAGITTGTGAFFAAHRPTGQQSAMHQSVAPVDEYGYIHGSKPTYTFTSSDQSLNFAAPRNMICIYNNSGTGVVADIEAIWAQKNMAAVTGVAFRIGIDRITSLGNTAGAFLAQHSLYAINPLDTTPIPNSLVVFAVCSASIVGIDLAFGGVNSQRLYSRYMHSEETNVAAQLQEALGIWPPVLTSNMFRSRLTAPPGYGYRLSTATNSIAGTYLVGMLITIASGP